MTLLLAAILALSPMSADGVPRNPEGCSRQWPATISVHRIHRKGSSIPARVDRVPFRLYVERVMTSGAWPAYKPMESLKVGAIAIASRAHWFVCHESKGYVRDGVAYDIHDGSPRRGCTGCDAGQLYRGPWDIHSKIKRAVDAVLGVTLRKRGRQAKVQWSGDGGRCGSGYTGNRLPEDAVTACARAGWGWRRIVRRYIADVTIVEPSAAIPEAQS
jgi:hypothetical protein